MQDQHKAERDANQLEETVLENDRKTISVDYNAITHFFMETFNIEESHVLGGSIPQENCDRIIQAIVKNYSTNRITGLNIGNFLGVAFTYILSNMVQNNNQSTFVSVDPNIPHRGISDLETKFISCLHEYNLQDNSLIINGYSLRKNTSNDGVIFDNYDPKEAFDLEKGCTGVLDKLTQLGKNNFQFVILDGNHHSEYLQQELERCTSLLAPNGILFLDDIDKNWKLLKKSAFHFLKANNHAFEELYYDGRILALRRK